jgi:hypothetical protein
MKWSAPRDCLSNSALLLTELSASCWFLACLSYQPCCWRQHVPPKYRLIFNYLRGVLSKKTFDFMIVRSAEFHQTIFRHIPEDNNSWQLISSLLLEGYPDKCIRGNRRISIHEIILEMRVSHQIQWKDDLKPSENIVMCISDYRRIWIGE